MLFRIFAWRPFVISSFRLAFLCCYFVFSRGVFSSFRMAFFRLFVFSLGVMVGLKDEITPREKTK